MVPLLVAALRDDRFYPSAPKFGPESPACYRPYLRQDALDACDKGLMRSVSSSWPTHLSHIWFPLIAPAKGRTPAVNHYRP